MAVKTKLFDLSPREEQLEAWSREIGRDRIISVQRVGRNIEVFYWAEEKIDIQKTGEDLNWLVSQVEKAKRYEEALKEIEQTSGTSMIHTFTESGHQKCVEIAELALEEEE